MTDTELKYLKETKTSVINGMEASIKNKKVSTGNYWFSISWNESKNKIPIKF